MTNNEQAFSAATRAIVTKILAVLACTAVCALLLTGLAGPASASTGIGVQLLDGSAPATVLAPGQSMTATVTVTVPAHAPLGLVAGNAPGSAALSVNTFWGYAYPAGGQVQLATAAGVRMYITVIAR